MITHPRLRSYLAAAADERNPAIIHVWDRLGLSAGQLRCPRELFFCLELFDGERDLREIQVEIMGRTGGQLVPIETLAALVQQLDEVLFLDSPRYREAAAHPIRAPRCIGCYEGDPDALRTQLGKLFAHPSGAGLPQPKTPDGQLRAVLLPHIDYARGGLSYTWGFKELVERTEASLFVIIGTAHYSGQRFTLTRKHFKTPLGVALTDQDYIDRLVQHHGDGLFDDELMAHLPEHSIELEVVFLQYLYDNIRPIRIVPLVVGSFQDCVANGSAPTAHADIGRMIAALRQAEVETPEPICYLISGDLAHIGPKFGDRSPVSTAWAEQSRAQDMQIVRAAETASPQRYFETIANEGDERRICGLPPTWTVLEAVQPRQGKLLHYDQYIHPRGHESVSFASMAFYR